MPISTHRAESFKFTFVNSGVTGTNFMKFSMYWDHRRTTRVRRWLIDSYIAIWLRVCVVVCAGT